MPCRPRSGPSRDNWSLADFDGKEFLATGEASFDLALSLYSLQSINDLPGALIQIRRTLKPDGLFLAALFGGDTLLRIARIVLRVPKAKFWAASARMSRPSPMCATLGGCCSARALRLPVADVERLAVRYSEPDRLGARSARPWSDQCA